MTSETVSQVRSEMTEQDWQDVLESEFVDYVSSPMTDKIGFVFEHPDIGLHGFEFYPSKGLMKPTGYERQDNDE